MRISACCFAALLAPTIARADIWAVAEAPAAIPVSDAQEGIFRPGIMPAFGVYVERGLFAVGLRMRVGVLRDGPSPGMNFADPKTGGLGTAGLAFRVGGRGPWGEVVVGGGLTGHDVVPTAEVGFGWEFGTGFVDFGPSLRVVYVGSEHKMDDLGSAELVLIGIDARFGKGRPVHPLPVRFVSAPVMPEPEKVPDLVIESDHDAIVDGEGSCAEDGDGCTVVDTAVVVHDDRIVLEERVLFDVARAHVHATGREMLARIAKTWRAHPEWIHMTIEGHADVRGSDALNDELSRLRAERVLDQLVKLGFAADSMDAVGFGRSRPVDPGMSEAAHAHNRRVELVIHRRGVQ
jgi:outer membrane protein OmpA-like peptidoglycan-associated protein